MGGVRGCAMWRWVERDLIGGNCEKVANRGDLVGVLEVRNPVFLQGVEEKRGNAQAPAHVKDLVFSQASVFF